ncbi:hypothetical protein PTKIN_Ptkin18bG0114800 [Pterospermum kingtungense]
MPHLGLAFFCRLRGSLHDREEDTNQPIKALRQYLNEEAKKNQFEQVERVSPGGPDPRHHPINN